MRHPERFHVLFAHRRPLRGRCPACEAVMDDTGCCLVGAVDLAPNRYGVRRVVTVLCTGTPSGPLRACPGCAVEVPGRA